MDILGYICLGSVILNVILFIILSSEKYKKEVILDPGFKEDLNAERILNRELQTRLGELELLHQQQVVKNEDVLSENAVLNKKLEEELERNSTILSQKKSSEVRTGMSLETLYPLIDGIGHDPKNLRFLGCPIDFISFDDDYITFIEIKSGMSKLTKRQKDIKKLVEDKKINWEEVRVSKGKLTIK